MPLTPKQIENLKRQLEKQKGRAKGVEGVEASKVNTLLYYRDLKQIVDKLVKETDKIIIAMLEDNKEDLDLGKLDIIDGLEIKDAVDLTETILTFEKQITGLENFAEKIAAKMAKREDTFHRKKFVKGIKDNIGVNVSSLLTDRQTQVALAESVTSNVALIKTIPSEYLDKIEKSLRQGIDQGLDFFSLKKDILKVGESTYKRARLIARDQTSKLNGNLNKIRQQEVGITSYIWRTSEDDNVRDSHVDNSNKKFRWDSPPETGHPGEDIQCRCIADPDLSHLIGLKEAS